MATAMTSVYDNISAYLDEARRHPLLSLEQEQELARRWREEGDEEALRQLIGSHLRLVIKVARGYAGYGVPLAELIAEGNVGLMQAANRFEPERGFRFATYAVWWIRASMQEHILHAWSLVKVGTTAAQKKLFFGLRKAKRKIRAADFGDLAAADVASIAEAMGVPEAEVISMNRRLAARDQSLNAPLREEGETEWQDWLVDDEADQEGAVLEAEEQGKRRALLEDSLDVLNERERHILRERRLRDEPLTLETLGQQYGISRERVRQIEARAFEKLQQAVLARAETQRLPA